MEPLKDLLKNKKLVKNNSKRPINLKWEAAEEFGKAIGLKTVFVLKLFREYGQNKVLSLRPWLADLDSDPKRINGLVVWKLKELIHGDKLGLDKVG